MVQKTPELAAAVSASGAPGCLRQFIVLEKGNVEGTLTGLMIAGKYRGVKGGVDRAHRSNNYSKPRGSRTPYVMYGKQD